MTNERHNVRTRRLRGPGLIVLALTIVTASACGDESRGSGAEAAEDSVPAVIVVPTPWMNRAMPRPAGDTLSMTATIDEYSIGVSPDSIDPGAIALLIQNEGERPHTIMVTGDNGARWSSLPIGPGGGVTMTMRIESGHYTLESVNPAYADRGMRGEFFVR
jgi:hypothetical protein